MRRTQLGGGRGEVEERRKGLGGFSSEKNVEVLLPSDREV